MPIDEHQYERYDPGRWAWRGLALLALVLFGPDVVLSSGIPFEERIPGLLVLGIIVTAIWIISRTWVLIEDGSIIKVLNQSRAYRIPVSDVVGVDFRRAHLVRCAHLELRNGMSVPVGAIYEILNTWTGNDWVDGRGEAGQLWSAIQSAQQGS